MKKILCVILVLVFAISTTVTASADMSSENVNLSDIEAYSINQMSCMDSNDSKYAERWV